MDQNRIAQTVAKHSGEFVWVRGVAIGMFAMMGLIVTQLFVINDNIATVENSLTNLDGRLTNVDGRLTNVEGRLTNVEGRLTELETDFSDLKAGQQQIVATLVQMGQQLDSLSVSVTERNNH